MPLANTFFLADVPPPWKRADLPPLKETQIRNPTSNHPLMRHLTGLDEIAFSEAFRFDLKAAECRRERRVCLETDRETAVLFVLAAAAFQDVVLAFPLVDERRPMDDDLEPQIELSGVSAQPAVHARQRQRRRRRGERAAGTNQDAAARCGRREPWT